MPSGAIIHKENFHECMAVNNIATLNSANFHREIFHKLSSICKICENSRPSKITCYTVGRMDCMWLTLRACP